jgi:hypothetical protein
MKRLFLLVSLLVLFVACDNGNQAPTSGQSTVAASSQSHEGCQCGAGKEGAAVWCDKCGVGYVDGKKVTDKAAVDKAAAAQPKADCKCGDKADCKCGDKAAGDCGHKADGACDHKGDCKCGDKAAK